MVTRILKIIIIIGLCCVVIAFILINFELIPYAIYPTKSSPHKLSIACYDVNYYDNRPIITLKHYVNGLNVAEYILEIKNGLHIQEPQSYQLPKLENGRIEVNVELRDNMNSQFTFTFEDAEDLYKKGLLIYLDIGSHYYNKDQFACFVSGKETTCYGRETDIDKWNIKADMPSLKSIPPKENPGYAPTNSGWREYKWVYK